MKTKKQLEAKLRKINKLLDKNYPKGTTVDEAIEMCGRLFGQHDLLKWILKSYSK